MIDWVSAVLSCSHSPELLQDGVTACINADGSERWHSFNPKMVEGTYSDKILIKSMSPNFIYVSGNPAKWLQGHNIFGTDDLLLLMKRFFYSLCQIDGLGLDPTFQDYKDIYEGNYILKRIDINATWFLKDRFEVMSWIRSAGDKTVLARRGRGVFAGDTLYYGKNSRRWSLKMYSKGHELQKRKLSKELDIPELQEFAEKALRIELTLRSLELKERGLHFAQRWTPDFAIMLLMEAIGKLEMSNNFSLNDDKLALLKPRLRLAYKAWLRGDDLRQDLPKMTYYRYRKELLEFGIDIANVQDVDKPLDNVVPLVRVLEALPASIPDWAYEKKLVVC